MFPDAIFIRRQRFQTHGVVFSSKREKSRSVRLARETWLCKSICFRRSEMPVRNSPSVSLITVIIFVCAGHGPSRSIMGGKRKTWRLRKALIFHHRFASIYFLFSAVKHCASCAVSPCNTLLNGV